jgi:tetratricopeptide (TPR) repeat protein
MRRTWARPLLVSLLPALAALPLAAQESRTSSDPWAILDGTYRPPPEAPPPPWVRTQELIEASGEWKALGETYRQSLERLGKDDRGALLKVVADLEVVAIADQPERRMPRLAELQLDVARELARHDPEILVPVFQLHHDLYLQHRSSRQWYLLLHSVSMVRELAALYVKEAAGTGAKMNAARILASLAGHLQAGQQPASVKLFEEVLALDPSNESAYLGIAAHYEKRGGPAEQVVAWLKRLLAVYPEHREGRLRLAVNKLRLGKADEAAALFAALLEEPGSDWVYRLAAQEAARLHARRGRIEKAIALLEKALERAGGDQKLCIQLAFLYDRNRQSFDAHRLAELARGGEPAAEAPRGRYNGWPHEALDHDREELRRLAESRVQLLARVLGRAAGPEVNP